LRLRSEAFRQEGSNLEEVRSGVASLPAVRQLKLNPTTGSLLVEYEPGRIEPDELVRRIADATGLTRVVDATALPGNPDEPVRQLVQGARELNRLVGEATNGHADLRSLVPVGLFAAGLYSLVRRPILPRWDNLFVWSYQLFMTMNARTRVHEGGRA
jgi:hypothetical protein